MSNQQVDVQRLLERLKLDTKRDGSELVAKCPAHEDRKPSWSINANSGQHHCFSCGWGGGGGEFERDGEQYVHEQRDAEQFKLPKQRLCSYHYRHVG